MQRKQQRVLRISRASVDMTDAGEKSRIVKLHNPSPQGDGIFALGSVTGVDTALDGHDRIQGASPNPHSDFLLDGSFMNEPIRFPLCEAGEMYCGGRERNWQAGISNGQRVGANV
jgi:hypothetical protein